MRYQLVNSNNDNRWDGITTKYTFGPTEFLSSGQAGYEYKLYVTKMSSNFFKAYPIEANWDTDANR